MGPWPVAVFGGTIAAVAVALGVFAVERVGRSKLYFLFFAAIALDVAAIRLGWASIGLGNVLVLLAAVSLGAWLGHFIADRQALLAVVVTACLFDIVAMFNGSILEAAPLASEGDPIRLMVILMPWQDTVIAPVSLAELVVLGVLLATVGRLGASRLLCWFLALSGLFGVLALERLRGMPMAHLPFLSAGGLLSLALSKTQTPIDEPPFDEPPFDEPSDEPNDWDDDDEAVT